jgi:hypothetical protein
MVMADIAPNPARNKALGFARRGFAVLPLYGIKNGKCLCGTPSCSSPGKHPLSSLVPHGLKDATTDPEFISEWFDEWPSANYGVLTDQLPTIDIDPRNGGNEAWRKLIRVAYEPHTWMVATGGGGRHIICGSSKTPVPCAKLARGVDLKGANGYVVGAGSLHASGKRYIFYRDCRPKETPLARLPEWVVSLVSQANKPAMRYTAEDLNKLVEGAVLEGERNDRITKLFGHVYGAMRPDRVVLWHLVYAWNAMNCDPPLSGEEVLRIAESISGRENSKRAGA